MKGFNPLQQVKEIQEKLQRMQEELSAMTVEGSAGGGMVSVVVSGRQEVLSIRIEPQVIDAEEIEMLQDLVVAAVNDGLRKSQELCARELASITGGLNIPGLKIPGLF